MVITIRCQRINAVSITAIRSIKIKLDFSFDIRYNSVKFDEGVYKE